MANRRGQKCAAAGASCDSTEEQQCVTRQDVLGAKVHAVMCAVRAREQRVQARKRKRMQHGEGSAGQANNTHNATGRTLNAANHTSCGGEEEKQRKPKTPRIEYYRVYPDRRVPATEEGIWDDRPRRRRIQEGGYDQVERRGPRRGIRKEARRQRVSIVPAGRRAVELAPCKDYRGW